MSKVLEEMKTNDGIKKKSVNPYRTLSENEREQAIFSW